MFWCWLQTLICSSGDIVPSDNVELEHQQHHQNIYAAVDGDATDETCAETETVHRSPPNPFAMFRTIAALIDYTDCQSNSTLKSHATNTNTGTSIIINKNDEFDNYNQYFKQIGIHFQKHSTHLMEQPPPSDEHIISDDSANQSIVTDQPNEYRLIDNFVNCNELIEHNIDELCDDNDDDAVNDPNPCSFYHSKTTTKTFSNTNNDLNDAFCGVDEIDNPIQSITKNSQNNSKQCHEPTSNNNNYNNSNSERSAPVRRLTRKAPNTLDLIVSNATILSVNTEQDVVTIKKRKLSSIKRAYNQINKYSDRFPLNGIIEECEYDSDIGKFNCKIRGATNEQLMSDNSSGSYEFSEEIIRTSSGGSNSSSDERAMNDLNITPKQRNHETNESIEQFNINEAIKHTDKIVMKRIEFFENICNDNSNINQTNDKDDKQFSTILCLSTFVLVVVILFYFPLPN